MLIRAESGPINYWAFMRNRFLRIFPLFLLIFFVAISIGRNEFDASDILYLFFSNLGSAPTSNSFLTGAAWTISVEFTFYAIFPFLAAIAINQGKGYLIRLVVLLLLFKSAAYFVAQDPKHVYYSTLLGRMDQFLIGMCSALIYRSLKQQGALGSPLWVLMALVLVWGAAGALANEHSFFAAEPRDRFWIFWPTVEALVWALLVVSYLSCRRALPEWLGGLLTRAGQLSYSWYLLHGLVILLWYETLGVLHTGLGLAADLPLNLVVVGGLSLLLAWFSYQTIERPFLEMRGRYT